MKKQIRKTKKIKPVLPYFVEVDANGCSKCGAGRPWSVAGPGEIMLSQSWMDEEDAAWMAEQLNDAYFAGKANA